MSIVNKALIVSLKISQWVGRKLDKDATDTVETEYKTDKRVGNYTKKLLPGANELETIQRVSSAMRQFFYGQTLPWCSDGSRMLAAQNYIDFTKAYRTHKAEFDAAVGAFLREYPLLKESARLKLGNLFREDDYPTQERLAGAFTCEVAFMPVPDVGDFRVEILDSEKETFLKQMHEIEVTAVKECWKRLYDVVYKASAKLSDPKAIFRDSLIENIQETCALLPKLNISDSPELEQMRRNVEHIVATIQPDAVRYSEHARDTAVRQLDEITNRMGAFMGSIK